jgi:hypothetical protein
MTSISLAQGNTTRKITIMFTNGTENTKEQIAESCVSIRNGKGVSAEGVTMRLEYHT